MKIRNGFVSNSSSSSFIIGYGSINPKKYKDLIKFLKKCDINEWHYKISTKKELYHEEECGIGFINFATNFHSYDEDELVLIIDIENNEGDGCGSPFYNDGYESNYDKAENEEFYPSNQQKIIEMLKDKRYFNKNKTSSYIIGADRNG